MGFPTKNHRQTSVLKLEEEKKSGNNRYRWLNKNNRADCDGENVQKPSTSHRCYIKNIDHRSSLTWGKNVSLADLQTDTLLQTPFRCLNRICNTESFIYKSKYKYLKQLINQDWLPDLLLPD